MTGQESTTAPQQDHVFSQQLFASTAPFSHACRAGDLWFLSGLIGQDPHSGQLVSADPAEQLDRMFANLGILLDELGLGPHQLVRVSVYLVDYEHFDLMNAKYAAALAAPYPARTTLQVAALPAGALFQVDAIAQASAGR